MKKWLLLDLDETVIVLHLVVCPIVFIWFYNRDWQGGVFKLMKIYQFLVFLAV